MFRHFLKKNGILMLLCIVYIALCVSMLSWGIPNPNHPFTYHMDEWHQLMAVKSLFKNGSPNVLGAANGPIFFFLQSGVFLIPFYIFKIIDPFVVKSAVGFLSEQQKIFEVLRLNTIVYGVGTMILVWQITKKYLHGSPFIATVFFMLNPAWIMLSNYFKYDIALIFWIVAALYALLAFSLHNDRKWYLLAGGFIGCAMAIKISALPLVLSYILAYILFVSKKKRKFLDVLYGSSVIALTFFILGIPDSISYAKEYYEFFYLNIITGPDLTSNFQLGMHVWLYVPLKLFPLIFGHGFYLLSLFSLLYFFSFFLKKENRQKNKKEFLLFITFILFIASLIPLKILATGNRVIVLLPFMAFFVAMFWDKVQQLPSVIYKRIFTIVLISMILMQIWQVYGWLEMKYRTNPRAASSEWILKHIPSQKIGIENIPIYQGIPDILLKEFYMLQENPKSKTQYIYEVVDIKTKNLPSIIVLTAVDNEKLLLKKSGKNDLVKRIEQEGYKKIKQFDPSWQVYLYFAQPEDVTTTGLIPLVPITIYQK